MEIEWGLRCPAFAEVLFSSLASMLKQSFAAPANSLPPVLLHSESVNNRTVMRFRADWSRKIPKKRTSSSVFCNTASDLQWQPLWREIARRCKNEFWPLWPCSPAFYSTRTATEKNSPALLVSGCFEIGTVKKLFYPHQLLSAVFV